MEQIASGEGASIILLQETRLTAHMSLKFNGMNTFRNDGGVGTAILIKDKIRAVQVYLDGLKFLDTTAIKVSVSGKNILIMSLYIPWAMKRVDVRGDLELIRSETAKYDDFLIGGDLNAHNPSWSLGIVKKNAAGTALEDLMRLQATDWCIMASTRPTFRNVSNMDMFIMRTETARPLGGLKRIETALCHAAISLRTGWAEGCVERAAIQTRTSFEGTDWPKFREQTTAALSKLMVPKTRNMSNNEIDLQIEETSEVIRQCIEGATRRTQVRKSDRRKLPDDLIELAEKKRRMEEGQEAQPNMDSDAQRTLQGCGHIVQK